MSLPLPYRAVLRTPHACGAFVTSLPGRLCYGIVSLSLVLTLTAGGRGYGLAGLVMALFGLTVVLVSPFRARVIDRHGPRRALPPMTAGFAAMLVAIAVIPPRSGLNDVAVTVLAAAAGACAPPLGVVMRSLWSALLDDRDLLQAAYSLDGVAEELLYVAGPVITGVITVVAAPAVIGGSALGGLGYGMVAWRISAQHRLVLLAAGLAVIVIPAALSPDLLVLALLAGLAGVLVFPALATAYVLGDSLALPKARNRAGNWVSSGYNAGTSAGAALSGQLAGRIPLGACLPLLAVPALLAVVPLARIRLAPTAETPAGPAPAGDIR